MNSLERARFGYTIFNIPIDQQIELAALAEQLGFDSVWMGEHVVLPVGTSTYVANFANYNPDLAGGWIPRSIYDETTRLYDLVIMAGAIARETRRISIITGVYLAALRHPLVTARSLLTLDELAKGRFQLGVGAGWNKGEFEALGVAFEDRGSILDETIDVLKTAMRGGGFEHHGRHYSFGPVQVSQRAFNVPIIIGGHGAPALRRAARVGDGWISTISNNIDEVLQLKSSIDKLRQEMGTADRPFHHWIKVNTSDRTEIARLRQSGVERFVLYGDQVWGAGEASFQDRCQRLKDVAAALDIGKH